MQMKTIIVPVDFSDNSESACKYAIGFAKKLNARIILMHAFESAILYSKIPLTTMQLDFSYMYNSAVRKMKTFRKKMSKYSGSVPMELSIQQGLPSARISELALETKADFIIIGSTGKGRVERIMFGSNALRTIKNAPCMVIVVPPKATFKGMQKIAYATDLTKDNLKHANRLLPLADLFKSEIIFLNISEDGDLEPKKLKAVKSQISKIVKYESVSGFITTDFDIVRGVNYSAKNHDVDCIAIYTRQKSLSKRIFGTSMASKLSLNIEMPMLIIHEEDFSTLEIAPVEKKRSKKQAKAQKV